MAAAASTRQRIGFMQGRLVAPVDGKIQAFPWAAWRHEFPLAEKGGFRLMEWTLDADRLAENPLLTESGRKRIADLSRRHGLAVETLTGDCFMQEPFWKVGGAERTRRLAAARAVIEAAAALGIALVVVPLVDAGSLAGEAEEATLLEGLAALRPALESGRLAIAFESDFPPGRLADFIARLPSPHFGINYDIGNSAALGFDCGEEIAAYGARILNVHVKDRPRGGTTVPLGQGQAEIGRAIGLLEGGGYRGRYILQTARAADGDHLDTACRYRDMVAGWLAEAA